MKGGFQGHHRTVDELDQLRALIQQLRELGLNYVAIGERLGVTKAYVSKLMRELGIKFRGI